VLKVWHSNRTEQLVDVLVEILGTPGSAEPFEPEIVVVPTVGLGRWLTLRLAEARGITANVRFPLPTPFLWELWRRVLDDVPERSAYDKEILIWRVYEALEGLPGEPPWEPLARYLEPADPLRRWQLAGRIADTFDRYLLYRPEWITEWAAGGGEGWQPALWRRIAASAGSVHRASVHHRFVDALRSRRAADRLPRRFAVFGVSTLPPAQLEDLLAVSRSSDVHLLFANPCEHDWTELRSRREVAREVLRTGKDADDLHFETGHPLLAACGRQGREFMTLLLDAGDEAVVSEDRFEDPGDRSGLARVQRAILDSFPEPVDAGDGSIEVHSCHGPMREIEVLHDRLLARFGASGDSPTAADVVVLTPSIEAYAPMIEAVFGTRKPYVPFAIADRAQRLASPTIVAVLALLELPAGRFEAGAVLGLLDAPAIGARFGIGERDLPEIRRLVDESGVRWGIDEGTRAAFGLPALPDNSWQSGLDRLILGFAMRDVPPRLFGGVRPHDDVEGDTAELVARFEVFARAVFGLPGRLAGERPVAEWCARIAGLLDDFVEPTDDAEHDDLLALRSALRSLSDDASAAGMESRVPVTVVAADLRARLERPGRPGRFLSGGVTFCEMVPMRAVPFRIVAIVGVGFDDFPRPDRADDFDDLARHRWVGDRSRRDDDRYLFLEAVLAARDALIVTYPGRTLRSGEPLPPSPPVEELLESVRNRDTVVFEHPLQPFSPRYFEDRDSRWFSYQQDLAIARRGVEPDAPFVDGDLPAIGDEAADVRIDDLVQLFRRPARAYLERLRIRLEDDDETLERTEPFTVEALEKWKVRDDLHDILLSGRSVEEAIAIARAYGRLPSGEPGRAVAGRLAAEASRLIARYRRACGEEAPGTRTIAIELSSGRLIGRLDGLTSRGRVVLRVGKRTARDEIALWVRHLAGVVSSSDPAFCSVLVDTDGETTLTGVHPARAREYLEALLDLWRAGARRPIPAFPEPSRAYAEALRRGTGKERTDARGAFCGSAKFAGDAGDAEVRLVWRGRGALSAEFEGVARAVWLPYLEALHGGPR